MTISEVVKLQKSMPVVGLKCKVKNAFEIESKSANGKTWKQQNVVLTDETGDLKAQVSEPKEDWKLGIGREVILSATEHKPHGLTGVKIDEYKNKAGEVVKQLKISQTAKIEILDTNAVNSGNIPKTPETAPNQAVGTPKPIVEAPDWLAKEMRELRTRVINTLIMTYKDDMFLTDMSINKLKLGYLKEIGEEMIRFIYGIYNIEVNTSLVEGITDEVKKGLEEKAKAPVEEIAF